MQALLRLLIDPQIDTSGGVRLVLEEQRIGWLLALLILVAAAVCVRSYLRIHAQVRPRYRAWMIGCRLAMLLVVLLLLLRPTLQYSAIKVPQVVLLVDTSASMEAADAPDDPAYRQAAARLLGLGEDKKALAGLARTQRIAIAHACARWLGKRIAGKSGRGYDLRRYDFDAQLREITDSEAVPEARGVVTDIGGALSGLAARMRGEPLIAVVLISDGISNQGGSPVDATRFYRDREIPIYTIGVGSVEDRPDLRISEVQAPEFAFKGSRISVRVGVAWTGKGGELSMTLREKGEPPIKRTIQIKGPRGTAAIEFELEASKPGKRFFTVEIPLRKGEASASNNRRQFSLEVLETFRVLYLTATPRPEFSFLRRFLERDSRIRVTALLAAPGRPGAFLNRSTNQVDRRMTGFPETDEQLRQFRVIVLGDIERARFTGDQLERLRHAVGKLGLGLLMLGGRHTFARGGYEATPIADMLPVKLATGDNQAGTRFVPQLTEEGRRSPFFGSRAFRGAYRWKDLPRFGGLDLVDGIKPSGTVLAVHPEMSNGAGKLIVMAQARYGRGRTIALTVDETWRWRFEQAHAESNPAAMFYNDFWGQVFRWVGIPQERPGLRIILPRKTFDVGRPAVVGLQLLDRSLAPIKDAKPRLLLRADGAKQARELPLVLGDAKRGRYEASLTGLQTGSYQLNATVEVTGEGKLADRDILVIREPSRELERTARDGGMLAALGKSGGGVYTEIQGAEGVLQRISSLQYREKRRFRRVGKSPLWDAWSLLALLVGLWTFEWYWRRKAGLL